MEQRNGEQEETVEYDAQRMIGHGSFGAVFLGNSLYLFSF